MRNISAKVHIIYESHKFFGLIFSQRPCRQPVAAGGRQRAWQQGAAGRLQGGCREGGSGGGGREAAGVAAGRLQGRQRRQGGSGAAAGAAAGVAAGV